VHYLRDKGSMTCIKEKDRAYRCIIWEVRAQKRFVGKTLVYQRSKYNAWWSICMYTYLRNICPFSSWTLPFCSKLWWLFCFYLLESLLVILTSGKGMISAYFFTFKPLSQRLSSLPLTFFRSMDFETLGLTCKMVHRAPSVGLGLFLFVFFILF
jgi:hypothetical protein